MRLRNEVLGKCFVCDGDTVVTEYKCRKCDTTIRGKFNLCKFCKLSDEQKMFAEIFIKNRCI